MLVFKKASPPSAQEAAMRAMHQETSLKHFEIFLKYPRNILGTSFNFFETSLNQTVKNGGTLKNQFKNLETSLKYL